MANTKTAEKKVEDTLDISQFFTMENEEKGVWFEPFSGSTPTGFEVLVYGPNSKKAWLSGEKYLKELESLQDETDEEVKHDRSNELLVEAVAERCGGIRGKDGATLTIKGKEVTNDDLKTILTQAPLIALSIWKYCQKADGFLEKKKKN